jgi:hypothetical protein
MVKKAPAKKPLRETPLQIRLTEEEKRVFTEAANRAHLSLSAWLRQAGWHAADSKHDLG